MGFFAEAEVARFRQRPQTAFERFIGLPVPPESLSKEGPVFTPGKGVPNTFVDTQDGNIGDNLRLISTTQVPTFEQERYEEEIIFGKVSLTTGGAAATKFAITPLSNECIELLQVSIEIGATALTFDFFKLSQKDATTGNIQIPYGEQTMSADVKSTVLVKGQTLHRINGGQQMRQSPGAIILCGADRKPKGFDLPDSMHFESKTTPLINETQTLTFLARHVPPPAALHNGDRNISGTA